MYRDHKANQKDRGYDNHGAQERTYRKVSSVPAGELSAVAEADLASGGSNRWAIKLDFIEGNPNVVPRGESLAPTKISYFSGSPDTWKTNVDT